MTDIESRQEKDESITQMSAQFVHDISTPLAIIQILSKTLETYLPGLLSAHQQLTEQGVETVEIPSDQRELLENSAVKIKNLAQQVNQAAKDYWKKIDQQFESIDESDTTQVLNSGSSISLENPLRVLIVEDDAIHQKIASKLLSNQHQIDIAVNGLEAVESCKRNAYDLVLMDLHMPVMDGREATAQIILLTNASPVIIGLTNRPLGSEKKQLLQQGFSGFVEKPLNISELAKLIEELNLHNKIII